MAEVLLMLVSAAIILAIVFLPKQKDEDNDGR